MIANRPNRTRGSTRFIMVDQTGNEGHQAHNREMTAVRAHREDAAIG